MSDHFLDYALEAERQMRDHFHDYVREAERQIAAAAERESKLETRLMGAHREVGALTWETSDLRWKLQQANEAISELRAMLERQVA